jgi:hypothetical protein
VFTSYSSRSVWGEAWTDFEQDVRETLAKFARQGVQQEPAAPIGQVRTAERSDPEGKRWPRGKTFHDGQRCLRTELP